MPNLEEYKEIDKRNRTTVPLLADASYTGVWADVSKYCSITIDVTADQAGTLYGEFSIDGSTTSRTVQLSSGTDNVFGVHALIPVAQYFRVRLVNGSTPQGSLSIQCIYNMNPKIAMPTSRLEQTINPYSDVLNTRAVLVGKTDGGDFSNVPVTTEGHLEVAIHGPRLPFGSIHAERLNPAVQIDAVYGINNSQLLSTVGHLTGGVSSATNTGDNNLFTCSTGTTALSFSSLQTLERIRYRPGQGVVGRFTALFSAPAASSILVAGLGTAESGIYFGYNGTSFGILHSTDGVREIQTLTVTTASTATNDYVVTLAGTAYTVTATNNNDTKKTAYEISIGDYTGWTAEQVGSTVVFTSTTAGDKTGTFSLAQTGAGTPAAGTFAETLTGVATTDTWVEQADWNGDVMDGTGSSGVTLDPTKGNVYQIGIQYLGFGGITCQIETTDANNNPVFVSVHNFTFANTRAAVTLAQPSFPFTMSAYSSGSTTDVSVSCASFAGFIEGDKHLTGPRYTYQRDTSGFVSSGALYPFYTVRNSAVHGHNGISRINQSIVNVRSISVAHDDATPIAFFLIKNATLAGTPDFVAFSTSSCTTWDQDATTCTYDNNEQLLFSVETGQASGETITFDEPILLQPGETLTLAARTVTGSATYVSASMNTREDQ